MTELQARLAQLHRRLDAWHSAVVGVVGETGPGEESLADPRLEAAADSFEEALGAYEEQALRVLGMEPEAPDEREPAAPWDTFAMELVVGVEDVADATRLDDVAEVVEAAAEDLAQRLEDSGYVVPEFRTARGSLDDDEEED